MKVLIFDCDGVLADTEQFAHLPAFNRMWKELGVPWSWSVEDYGEKLKISGGKERMSSLFKEPRFLAAVKVPDAPAERDAMIAQWHKKKTAIYGEMIDSGQVPGRSGIRRLSEEALAAGWTLGVCSTSSLESVEAVLRHVVGEATAARFALILAGDVVKRKKPDPEIYNLAAERLGAKPVECVVIEDSRNGLLSAHNAGMKCIVTVSGYTADEDFTEADIVLTALGDPDGEKCQVLANNSTAHPGDYFTVRDLEKVLHGS